MCNGECSNKVIDKHDKYQRVIDGNLKPTDENGNIIQENMVYASELDDIILYYLYHLNPEDIHYVDTDIIIQKLGVPKDNVFISTSSRVTTYLINLDEYIRYIRHKEKCNNQVDIFISRHDLTRDYEYHLASNISTRVREKLEDYGCNVESVERHITEYIVANHIQVTDFDISTLDGVGVKYRSAVDVLYDIMNIVLNFIDIVRLQGKAVQDKVYIKALDELEDFINYLVNDDEYRRCTNKAKRQYYKAKGKFKDLERFSNIAYMLDNKPIINTEQYIRYKEFYNLYDNVFDQAYSMIKWKEV